MDLGGEQIETSVMAVFSPVFRGEDHSDAAIGVALGMRSALERFNELGLVPVTRQGIGVHTATRDHLILTPTEPVLFRGKSRPMLLYEVTARGDGRATLPHNLRIRTWSRVVEARGLPGQ